jgi:Cdc6-like AAA superfamily ATPase
MDEPRTNQDWLQLELDVARLFSAAPLRTPDNRSDEELYAGRSSEAHRLMEAVQDPAKHIVLYGERGVGKTSISNNFWKKYDKLSHPVIFARVQVYPSDNFSSLWLRVLEEFKSVSQPYCKEFKSDFEHVSPDIVRRELALLRKDLMPIIIIDEFDQLRAEEARTLSANLLKSLHDNGINVTILLIGVADNVGELISNHQSLRRVLSLIKLERMSAPDLNEILDRRLQLTPVSLSGDARTAIVRLSCGLPYYVQTLGKFAAQNAIRERRTKVDLEDVEAAIDRFIVESGESFYDAYQKATGSRQVRNIFEEMTLASALAPSDLSGFFKPLEVTKVLNFLQTDEDRRSSQVQQYLSLLASDKRGEFLLRRRIGTDYQFRFSDATMQPFIIMRAIKDRRIADGIQVLLSYWRKEETPDGEDQLGTAEAHAAQGDTAVHEESGPEMILTGPAEHRIDPIIVPTAIQKAVEESPLLPASGSGLQSEAINTPTLIDNAGPMPPTSGSKPPPEPQRKSIFHRLFG